MTAFVAITIQADSRFCTCHRHFVSRGLLLLLGFFIVRFSYAETEVWSAQGAANYDLMGLAVSAGSDITGDGIPDVAVGSSKGGSGSPGQVTVRSATTGTVLFTLNGSHNHDRFGQFLSYVPDVNADGYMDLAVGAPSASLTSTDRSYVRMYSGINGTLLWTVQAGFFGERYGTSILPAGDVNADGTPDVIFGAPGFNGGGEGKVVVLSGSNGAQIWSLIGSSSTTDRGYGAYTSGVGDINGDGYGDFVHTGYGAAGTEGLLVWRSGQNAAVIRRTCIGPETFPNGCLFQMQGVSSSAIAPLGDVNGDNVPDTAFATAQVGYSASIVIRSGASDSVIRVIPSASTDSNSFVVHNIGDINGDGVADILQSSIAYSSTNTSRILAYSGRNGALLLSFRGPDGSSDFFGEGLASPGDLDGDGVIDVLVGSPSYSNTFTSQGRVQMFKGIRMKNSCSYVWLDSDVPACLL